jgi:beta-glucosidase
MFPSKISLFFFFLLFSLKSSISLAQNKSITQRVDSVMKLMTLEEKIGQMNQYNGFFDITGPAPSDANTKKKYDHLKSGMVGSMLNIKGVSDVRKVQKLALETSRLKIPLIFGFDVIHGHKTISPIPLAESASWDMVAIEASARIAAIEASAEGINWTFAPMVDISRDPRWGRVMEGAGEDPFLGSKIGVARVKGFQGNDLAATNTIAACIKHFAGYAFAESGKDYNTVDVGTSTLYNTIFPPFKACSDAGARTFMNSFNELNGIPATGNAYLQRDILKGKWGFKGFVVSDWGSIGEMIAHRYATDIKDASFKAIRAGSDMDMESYGYVNELKALVTEKKVDIKWINDAVSRILKLKFELGLFDDPYRYCDEKREKEEIGSVKNVAGVLDMAKKSIVLLKNDTKLLPLPKTGKKIALIGTLADDTNSPLGNWRLAAKDKSAVSVLEGMQAYKGNPLTFANGPELAVGTEGFIFELKINTTDTSGFAAAIQAAKDNEIVVMVLGEHGFQTGEGRSRSNIDLPGLQESLLKEVMKVNKNVVLVLMNGRPLTINWAAENVPTIMEAWQLGTQSGNAIANVLYGDYNPSGKLPMTFPRSVGQIPIYYNHKNTGRQGPIDLVFWSHHGDISNSPLYPFGYGLSYTDFAYSNLKIEKLAKQKVKVTVNVKNTGSMDGEEVVQLYLTDKIASITRPVKELKGFKKIMIKNGTTQEVTFELNAEELGFYDNEGKFIIEQGSFDVMVGGSSESGLKATFEL